MCKSLKCGKAPGWDRITPEHVKYGGDLLMRCLTSLFNIIIVTEVVPTHFKKGVIIPIPKGTKDRCKQDNYRGITLSSVFAKVFEKVILERCDHALKQSAICNLQGAGQKGCSSI